MLLVAVAAQAQESDIKPAAKGVVYGEAITAQGNTVTPANLQANLVNNAFEGKITGKVKEVCKSMGCWITLEKADGTTLMVKSKDHGFFMPQNLVGKTVVVEGIASVKEVTEATRKHQAEDAGGAVLFRIDDTYALAQLGVGLVFKSTLSLRPSIDLPLGLEGGEPTVGLTVGYSFGRRTGS